MKIKAIITGSTGMIGKGLLLECLKNDSVESILVVNRHPVGITHPGLKEIIHRDFSDLSMLKGEIAGYNTCFFCLGISAAGLKEQEYHRITYELTVEFATLVLRANPDMTFCYVSGAGTDETEKGRTMWARVKGKTENALLSMGFRSAYMFRPAFIMPLKGIRSRTRLYNVLYLIMKPFYPFLKRLTKYVTDTEKLGQAMIHVALHGHDKRVLENSDINQIATERLIEQGDDGLGPGSV